MPGLTHFGLQKTRERELVDYTTKIADQLVKLYIMISQLQAFAPQKGQDLATYQAALQQVLDKTQSAIAKRVEPLSDARKDMLALSLTESSAALVQGARAIEHMQTLPSLESVEQEFNQLINDYDQFTEALPDDHQYSAQQVLDGEAILAHVNEVFTQVNTHVLSQVATAAMQGCREAQRAEHALAQQHGQRGPRL